MSELIVDCSVVIKWFRSKNEQHVEDARALLAAYLDGNVDLAVPPHLYLEVLNSFGRKWGADLSALEHLLSRLQRLGLTEATVAYEDLPNWIAAGLTAYDATYVALAQARATRLITADQQILEVAPAVSLPIAQWQSA